MATSRASSPDRRVHPRFAGRELRGLYAARVKYGEGISILNLSAGGIWFETTGRLTPESIIVLEFLGPANALLVPSRVLRCQSLYTIERGRTKGACAFKRLIRLKDLVTGTTRPLKAELLTDDSSPWQQCPRLAQRRGHVGSTLNYSRDGTGFFIHPSDSDFGIARVFVTPSGIGKLRLL